MTVPSRLPPRAWLVVGLLWFVAFFNFLDRLTITTMHGSILRAFPITEAQFGLLTSAFLWTYALASPFAGFLSDRFSRSRVIITSMTIWSMVMFLSAYAKNFEQLVVMRGLMGLSEACYLPAGLALISDYHRGSTRSLATGIHMTGVVFGGIMSGMGGWLAEKRSWSYSFSVVGIAGIAYCAVLIFTLRDAPRENRGEPWGAAARPRAQFGRAVASLLGRGAFIIAIVYWGFLGAVTWLSNGWLPVFLQEHFHLTQTTSGFTYSCFCGGGALVGMVGGGALADRWGRTRPRGRIFVPAIALCAAVPGMLLLGNSGVLAIAIFGILIYGATVGSTQNMMPIVCLIADPRYCATGYGILNMSAGIAAGLAVYAGGALRDRHVDLSVAFTGAAVLLAFCSLLLFLMKLRPPSENRIEGGSLVL